ncbi:MAG: Gfo/Idh/MocA family oxidoreductase [Geodermatophilaceae bacterium]|nr:Gfo/Idh/MocA family oxidoreductase [Geodermatophilaceae bacterium]
MPSISWRVDLSDPQLACAVEALRGDLADAGWGDAGWAGDLPLGTVVAVYADRPLADSAQLLRHDRPVLLCGPTLSKADGDGALAEAAGLLTAHLTPRHDVRVRATPASPLSARLLDHAHGGSAHLGEHTHLIDRVLLVDKTADDVEPLLMASIGLQTHPVATWRRSTGVLAFTLGSTSESLDTRSMRRLLLLALRHGTAVAAAQPVRVGLLGYGAIGHEHSRAVQAVAGLELAAVCDTDPDRVAVALAYAPEARGHTSPGDLVADPNVDVVVVSTPPASHVPWALRLLEAGKHVVVEKPFAITTAEADEVLALAQTRGLLACVYQNRRFDPDYLALRRVVREGRIGRPFQIEAFVGGFGHPCNLWHSDDAESGGAYFDWGAHVLDQVLDLIPGPVEHVTATTRKLRWHDVTNADHSRVTMHFVDGTEAEFVYSDLAAALKPRWYVLGTDGAVTGQWRTEKVVSRNDIGTLTEDVLAPADSPPLMQLHSSDGSLTQLATPYGELHPFHTQLADLLQLGLPMGVTGAQSRRVLGVMEAARESASRGGVPVAPL